MANDIICEISSGNELICEMSSAGEIAVEINAMTYWMPNEELALKASVEDVALKADKTYVDSQDSLKADKTYVDNQDAALTAQLAQIATKVDTIINVKSFGAIGDGTTDDTQAFVDAIADLPNDGGVLYIPFGTYLIPNGGVVVDKPISILGEGAGTYESGGSRILCPSATANLFTLNKPGIVMSGIAFVNTSVSRPTAGSAILCTDFDWGRIERCLFRGFWNNVQVDSGYFYSIRDTAFLAPVNYGCYMRNTAAGQHDHGDQVLEGCNFSKYGDTVNGATAVKWESGGGLRLVGCKVNAGTQPGYTSTGFFSNGFVTHMSAGSTSVHTITGCSIEGFLVDGIKIGGEVGASFGKISIVGNEFLSSGSDGSCITIDGVNMTTLNNVVINGNVGYGFSGGVTLRNLTNAVVVGNNFADCTKGALNLTKVKSIKQSENLWKSTVNDYDGVNYTDATAGHYRGLWKWGYDIATSSTFSAGKIHAGSYSAILVEINVFGNVATVGEVMLRQKRIFKRATGASDAGTVFGTDLAIGTGSAEITITYDVSTNPFIKPVITSVNSKTFTGGMEIIVDGIITGLYYTA